MQLTIQLYLNMLLISMSMSFIYKNSIYRNVLKQESALRMVSVSITTSSKRISAGSHTLDTQFISENFDLVISHLKSRKASSQLLDDVSKIPVLRTRRNALIVERDSAKSFKKTLSQQIGGLMKSGKMDEVTKLKLQVDEMDRTSDAAEEQLLLVDGEIDNIVAVIPNLIDDRVPDGNDDSDNLIVRDWGTEKRKLVNANTASYLWHDEIAHKLGGLDVEAASRIAGARFSVLKGSVARLERALGQYFLDFHSKRGYEEVNVPLIVTRSTLQGTGQLPKFEDDLFKVSHSVAGEDAFLIPTSEVPVTNLYRDQVLNSTQLPVHHVCLTPCFRAEAGSYGRDTRGLLRQHQFLKVELVKICTPDTSQVEHENMVQDVEALLQSLELPYRVMVLCSGDMGFSARICYDIEVWLPGQQMYREISSISNCYDFQSRRMSLRYRPHVTTTASTSTTGGDHKKATGAVKKVSTVHPHTLNGSGVAVGRALVAILENYYNPADGSVTVPVALRPYMGGLEKIIPKQ